MNNSNLNQHVLKFNLPKLRWLNHLGGCLLAAMGAIGFAEAQSGNVPPAIIEQYQASVPDTAAGQSVTLLPDGRWLLLGGCDATGRPTDFMQTLDKKGEKPLSLVTRLSIARAGHTATVLADGSILIVGGTDSAGRLVSIVERYYPDAQRIESMGDIGMVARAQHTATLLMDGRLLFIGGIDSSTQVRSDAQVLNPQTGLIETINSRLDTERFNHLAKLLPSDYVLVWGGKDHNQQPVAGGALYDRTRSQFLKLDEAPKQAISDKIDRQPSVQAMLPAANSKTVPVDTRIALRFSKALSPASLTEKTVTLIGPSGAAATKVVAAEGGLLVFVTPQQQLLPGSHYTLFIQGAADTEKNVLPFYAAGFQTETLAATGSVTGGTTSNFTNGTAGGSSTSANQTGIYQFGVGSIRNSDAGVAQPLSLAAFLGKDKEGLDEFDDSDVWIPGPANYQGNWRSGWTHLARPPLWAKWQRLGDTAAFAASFRWQPQAVNTGVTVIAGQVLRLNGRPLAGVTLSMGDQATITNAFGEFQLSGVPAGIQTLIIDGGTANSAKRAYGRYEYQMEVEAGRTNVLDFPVWMSRLDTRHVIKLPSPTTEDMTFTHPDLPGFELQLPAGTVIRDAKGKIVTEISITPIPMDQPPFPMPYAEVPVYYTLQPGGAVIQGIDGKPKAAKLVYPNYSGQPHGARFKLFGYDPGGRGWYDYAMGTVSPDGKQIITDKDFLIYQFTAASAASPGGTPPAEGPNCTSPSCACPTGGTAGDPVSCHDGLFMETQTDLMVRDVVPIAVTRTYRTNDANQRGFGVGANSTFDLYLSFVNQVSFQADAIEIVLPSGGRIPFTLVGTNKTYTSPGVVYESQRIGEFYKAQLALSNPSSGREFVATLKDGRRYGFSYYQSRLKWIEDRYGNRITITRDSNNRVSQVLSPNNRYINFSYGVTGCTSCISQLTDNIGRTVSYQYDTAGHLIKVTDPENGVTQYSYDPSTHRILTVTDARNNLKVINEYYGSADGTYLNGRVKRQTYADNTTNLFTYTFDANGNTTHTEVADERGVVKRLEYNTKRFITRATLAVGKPEQQVTTNNWDATTQLLTSTTDALNRTTAYQYDSKGNVTQVTKLSGTANAQIWRYTYDSFGQVAATTDPLNHTKTNIYDMLGNLIQIKDALNNTADLSYNGAGQLQTVTRYVGGAALKVTYAYSSGDLVSLTDPLNRTQQFFTDAIGRIISVKDALGNVNQTAYDKLDRVTKTTDPLGQTVQLGYDANNNLTSFTDGKNNITQFAYEARNRVSSKTDPLTQTESYQYDPIGNLKQITDRNGQVSGYTYDFLNRVSSAGFGATTANPTVYTSTIGYTWDAGNRLGALLDSVSGTVTRSYDDLDRFTQEQSPQGTVNYTYYPNNLRQTMTVQGQPAVNYTYDDANRLTEIAQGAATVGFTYDTANRRTTLRLPSGVQITYAYDSAGQLTSLAYQNGATSLGNLTYAYDAVGSRISMGGSLAQTTLPLAITSTTINNENQVTTWGGQTSTYDNNGAMTAQGALTYVWDERKRLKQIKNGSAVTASFAYDAFNRRIGKTIGSTTTNFLHDGWQIIQELNGTTPTANLLTGLGLDQVYRRTAGGSAKDYLTDALGSTIALTSSSGSILTSYKYDPYGTTTVTGAASTNAFQYTGRENDGTGLYYYRNRYYSPGMNRFISEDPIGFAGGQNLAAYVEGNPINYVDPMGQNPVLTGIGIVTTGYAIYKFCEWTKEASDDAEKAQQANQAAQDAITAMMNGQPYNPSDIQAAKDATQKSLDSDAQVVNNLPPGTTASPFNKVRPRK